MSGRESSVSCLFTYTICLYLPCEGCAADDDWCLSVDGGKTDYRYLGGKESLPREWNLGARMNERMNEADKRFFSIQSTRRIR